MEKTSESSHKTTFEAYPKDNKVWTWIRKGARPQDLHVLLQTRFSSILWQLRVSPGLVYTHLWQTAASTFQTERHPPNPTLLSSHHLLFKRSLNFVTLLSRKRSRKGFQHRETSPRCLARKSTWLTGSHYWCTSSHRSGPRLDTGSRKAPPRPAGHLHRPS